MQFIELTQCAGKKVMCRFIAQNIYKFLQKEFIENDLQNCTCVGVHKNLKFYQ